MFFGLNEASNCFRNSQQNLERYKNFSAFGGRKCTGGGRIRPPLGQVGLI